MSDNIEQVAQAPAHPSDPHGGVGDSNPIGEYPGDENDEFVDHDHHDFVEEEEGDPNRRGDNQVYEPAAGGMEQADPIEKGISSGSWLEWYNDNSVFKSRQSGGTINWAIEERKWVPGLYEKFRAATPLFETLRKKLYRVEAFSPVTVFFKSLWGYGERTQSAWNTQAGYVDSFNFSIWVTNPRNFILPVEPTQVLYDVPLSMSVFGRSRTHTNLMAGLPLDAVKTYIGETPQAVRLHQKILTKATRGDTHQALLTLAFSRLFAIKLAEESGCEGLGYNTTGKKMNEYFIPLKGDETNVKRAVAQYVNDYEPSNLITLPLGSTQKDFLVMHYLAGGSRLYTTVSNDGAAKVVYSPFDGYRLNMAFLINPLCGNKVYEPIRGSDVTIQLTSDEAEDLLSRYINEHNLWSQAVPARAHALLLVSNQRVGVATSLPMPCHFSDYTLGMFANPRAAQEYTRVIEPGEQMMPIVATSWMLNLMSLDVLCESVFTCFEENGVALSSQNFVAQAALRLGDVLPEGLSHLTMPVVEKLLGEKFPDVNQYIPHGPLELAQHLTANYNERPLRFSSYLYLEDQPEEEALGMIFNESLRSEIWKRKDCTMRERVVAGYIAYEGEIGYNHDTLRLDYYNVKASRDRIHVIPDQTYNKNQLPLLRGKPCIHDVAYSLHQVQYHSDIVESIKDSMVGVCLEQKLEITMWDELTEAYNEKFGPGSNWYEDSDEEEDELFTGGVAEMQKGERTPHFEKGALNGGEEKLNKGKQPVRASTPIRSVSAQEKKIIASLPAEDVMQTILPLAKQATQEELKARKEEGKGYQSPKKPARTQAAGSNTQHIPIRNAYAALEPEETIDQSEEVEDASIDDDINQHLTKYTRRESSDKIAKKLKPMTDVEYLNATIKSKREILQRTLERSNPSKEDAEIIDSYFVRGKDSQLKRAMYTVGNLCRDIRKLGCRTARVKDCKKFLTNVLGGKNAWAVTVMLFILGNTLSEPAYQDLVNEGLLSTSYEDWNSKWSAFNDITRNRWAEDLWAHSEDDFTQSLYIGNTVGRPHRDVDWDDETKKRSQPGKEIHVITSGGTRESTEQELRAMLMDTLEAEAVYKPGNSPSFADFYKKRANWMIRGSMSGEKNVAKDDKAVWLAINSEGLGVRTNTTKTDVAEYVTAEQVWAVLENAPIHLARAHTKGNENGKIRAIYGSLFSHYVLGSYWSWHYEDRLSLKSASLNKSNSTLLTEAEERATACREGKWITCLDYPDFNASHSCRMQRLVVECIADWCKSKGFKAHEDLDTVTDWYAKSFENQYFRVPTTGEWHRANSTMFSGVRQTTIFNTLINIAYHRHYLKASQLLGSPVSVHHAYMLGDDGWVAFYTKEDAHTYVTIAEHCKMALNPIKQLVSQGRGEYLRLIYGRDGNIRGCPVRSLSSAVHGNVEANKPSVAAQRVTEFYSQWAMLARRGMDRQFCQRVFEQLAIFEIDKDNKVGKHTVLRFLYGTKRGTGLGLYPIAEMPDLRDRNEDGEVQEVDATVSEELKVAEIIQQNKATKKFKASGDFVSWIEEKYGVTWRHLGKQQAASLFAAANLMEGGAKANVQHQAALVSASQSIFSRSQWAQSKDQYRARKPIKITAEQVEQDYRMIRATEDKLLAVVADIGKLLRFMDEASVENLKRQLSEELGIGIGGVEKALNSLRNTRPDKIDYVPTPYLVPELEGLYTMWLVVQSDPGNVTTIPNWLYPASSRMRY
ncbi:RNA dependent RNA polymerase [Plasmopara viticola lesion associated botybirna 1]|uniref:RNA-directed RNA polymerase n=1 Tax=Plasmopara viticola lesion associated botybirna 1 TaxID=2689573 RepID=A0A6B9KGX1_9VIRU|nr:RNA dependent RNA polymerase [Plasmopara viticola lesion associated botybirna 1]QLC27589.1 RNA dependent RNA polymerase [Erysiphe necator associated botybirnavirus 1]